MFNNRRNLVFRVSIVINVFVLLYAAMHLSSSPTVEWVPVTLDGTEHPADRYVMGDMKNFTGDSSARNFEDLQRVTPTASPTNRTASSTTAADGIKLVNEVPSQEPTNESDLYQVDESALSESTLSRLRTILGCTERPFLYQIQQRGEFWALKNYVRAEHGTLLCHETITYTTHAGFEFLDNVQPLVERWMAPISLAVHAPGSDISPAVNSIRYLRDCLSNDLVRQFVTFHIFFSNKHIPDKIPDPEVVFSQPYNCSLEPPYKTFNLSNTYTKHKNLLYPVNMARNIARETAMTHFVLASDIELYPSPNLVPKFLNMIARNNPPLNSTNPRVFPLILFEVDAKSQVPTSKTELQEMLKKKTAIPFHKFVCPNCHNIPQRDQWMAEPEKEQMDVFHIGKRQGKFIHWEPIYIGTHLDPYYDDRLSWEGKQDKMTQGYVLCVKNYDFMILNNAFLIHKPGIKKYKKDPKRAAIAGKQTRFIKSIVMPELKKIYGERKGCTL